MFMIPKKFDGDFFDDFMYSPMERMLSLLGDSSPAKTRKIAMKTDVKEKDGNYELEMDLPGFKKEDVKIELEKGYLTVSASNDSKCEEKECGYIRRERYRGEYSRSFYVGENLKAEDMKAKFEDGILRIAFPKEQPKEIQSKNVVEIE